MSHSKACVPHHHVQVSICPHVIIFSLAQFCSVQYYFLHIKVLLTLWKTLCNIHLKESCPLSSEMNFPCIGFKPVMLRDPKSLKKKKQKKMSPPGLASESKATDKIQVSLKLSLFYNVNKIFQGN